MDAQTLLERAERLKALVEADINIDLRGGSRAAAAKINPADFSNERDYAQAAAAAGNSAQADALKNLNLNDPASIAKYNTPVAQPTAAQQAEWSKDATADQKADWRYGRQGAASPAGTTAPATPAAKPQGQAGVLNVGSQGAEVSALQKKLGITADGKYGPATQQAVMALQKKLGVTADGAYGPITKAAHDKMTPGQAAKPLAPPTNTNVADAGQPGHTVANDTAPKATTDTAQANQVLQGIQAGRIDPNSAKGQATIAVPEVPVPAGNPGGVGKNQTLKPDEKAAAEEALKDPNVGARDKAYYAGRLGVPVPAQTAKPNVGAPAPAAAPATPAAAPATPAAAPATPQGQTAGGASTAYRVRTPKGAAAQNQPQESLDRILHLATYLK